MTAQCKYKIVPFKNTHILFRVPANGEEVVQWIGICPPMQGTRVQARAREDSAWRGVTKPMGHNYWACTPEPASRNSWSPCAKSPRPIAREVTTVRNPCTAMKSNLCTTQLEKARVKQRRPSAAKNKDFFLTLKKKIHVLFTHKIWNNGNTPNF